MYKEDLALNNLEWLICHKTSIKPNLYRHTQKENPTEHTDTHKKHTKQNQNKTQAVQMHKYTILLHPTPPPKKKTYLRSKDFR